MAVTLQTSGSALGWSWIPCPKCNLAVLLTRPKVCCDHCGHVFVSAKTGEDYLGDGNDGGSKAA